MKVIVNTEGLHRQGDTVKQLNGTLENIMNQFENSIIEQSDYWKGNASQAFAAKIVYVKNEFKKIEDFLEEYSSLIMELSKEYDDFESSLTSRIMNV